MVAILVLGQIAPSEDATQSRTVRLAARPLLAVEVFLL